MKFDPLHHLTSLGVDEQVAADWLALRKAKKAPATLTAINRIEAQAKLAGWPLGEALAECCEHGWQGFKAEWVQKRQANTAPRITQYQANQAAIANSLFGRPVEERVITGELLQ